MLEQVRYEESELNVVASNHSNDKNSLKKGFFCWFSLNSRMCGLIHGEVFLNHCLVERPEKKGSLPGPSTASTFINHKKKALNLFQRTILMDI